MARDYFVDCHCHLFNIEDAPLYPTIKGRVAGVSRGQLLLGALFVDPNKELDAYKSFLDFFDRLRRDNAKGLTSQICEALSLLPSGVPEKRIITPLIMDFDEIESSFEDVSCQASSLIREIGVVDEFLKSKNMKVLPFMGVDLRKFAGDKNVADVFDQLLARCGGLKGAGVRRDVAALGNGDMIGIKLYPPIGFNPFSVDSASMLDAQYKQFYQMCIERELPITVHCQPAKGSYYAYDSASDEVNANTHAKNWEKVFQDESLQALRINFAHFGGDGELVDAVWRTYNVPSGTAHGRPKKVWKTRDKIPEGSWARSLVRLLKKYDHTYADLGAFNYDVKKARLALIWLLVWDECGELAERVGLSAEEDKYKLKDKLLWGSDIPMILGEPDGKNGRVNTYDAYLAKFIECMDVQGADFGHYPRPKKEKRALLDQEELIGRLTGDNPLRFLFG